MVQFLKVPVNGNQKNSEKINNSGHELWYEWDLLVFCKQTSLQLVATFVI